MFNRFLVAVSCLGFMSCGGGNSSPAVVSQSGGSNPPPVVTPPTSTGPSLYENVLLTKSFSGGISSGNTDSYLSISEDGSVVGFSSKSENLINSDTNGKEDAFVFMNNEIKRVNTRFNQSQTFSKVFAVAVDLSGDNVYFSTDDPNMLSASQGVALRTYRASTSGLGSNTLVFNGSYGAFCAPSFSSSGDMYYSSGGGLNQLSGTSNSVVVTSTHGLSCPSVSTNGDYASYFKSYNSFVNSSGIFKLSLSSSSESRVDIEDSSWNNDGIPDLKPEAVSDISDDGRYVVFASKDSRIMPSPMFGSGVSQIYLRDTVLNTTTLVSKGSSGGFGDFNSTSPSISADGGTISFSSLAQNINSSPTVGSQVYTYDVSSQALRLISKDAGGGYANGTSKNPKISKNGSWLVYISNANNIVSLDNNGLYDVYRVKLR